MSYEFNGLPLHILLIHAVVILVPLATLLTVLHALWPAARRRLGFVTPLVALIALILVPITVNAGEWLEERVASTPLIRAHTSLGDTLLPWAIGVFVVALVEYVWFRVAARRGDPRVRSRGVRVLAAAVLTLASIGVGAGAVSTLVAIGESGSKAVWTGSFSESPR